MKAGSNYLRLSLRLQKVPLREHSDEISAYLSRHHSLKTNTPFCLWHTKAVINMAHWSEDMYRRSIQCRHKPRWSEGKMMSTMHWFFFFFFVFYFFLVGSLSYSSSWCFDRFLNCVSKSADFRKDHVTVCLHMPLSETLLILCFRFLSLYIIFATA